MCEVKEERMTRPGLLKSQINNRYSVKRTHTPFGNAVKHFASVKTGVFLGSRSREISGGWPDATEFSQIQLRNSFTVLAFLG
jgi:hypothetical protein